MGKRLDRDSVTAYTSLLLIFGGFYGMHTDWTMWAMVIPLGWLLLGFFFDQVVNGKDGTKISVYAAAAAMLLLVNVSLILVHRDTQFIIGRLICSVGLLIMIIRSIGNTYTEGQREIEKRDKEIRKLKDELFKAMTHHDK